MAGTVAVLAALGAANCYGPPKFWRNFEGWAEPDVVAYLGTPRYDSRLANPRAGAPYTLGWAHGMGDRLSLRFNPSGIVIEQSRSSK